MPVWGPDVNGKSVPFSAFYLNRNCSWTKEAGGLQSMGLQRVRHDLAIKQQQQNCF